MFRHLRKILNQPLWIIAALWPLVLLTPFVPGLPRPNISGLSWRQEFSLALLFCVTLGLLARRVCHFKVESLRMDRRELLLLAPLVLFVLWSAVSMLWATSAYPAFHYALTWGAYSLFFLLLRRVADHRQLLYRSLTSLTLIMLTSNLISIIGFWGGTDERLRYNGLGEPSAMMVPFFVALALGQRQRSATLLCGAAAVLSWLTMLQSSERAPFIGASAGLFLLVATAFALPKFRPRGGRRAVLLLTALIAVTVIQTTITSLNGNAPPVIRRLGSTNAADPNIDARLLFWGVGAEMLRSHSLIGVGANNYEIMFSEARAQFVAQHPDSSLVNVNENFLTMRAHNEYLQIAAELGIVGFALFALFCVALIWAAMRALRCARSPLVPGAIASSLTFALSSGASSVSFRWMGSGLLFFLMAAIISSFALRTAQHRECERTVSPLFAQGAMAAALIFSVVLFCGMGAQALNVMLHGAAQMSLDPERIDGRYQAALRWNPYDAATHFNYGLWLYNRGHAGEAVVHLRYAVARGFNSSFCYAYLVAAETGAGETAALKTLPEALKVYPRSVFLRTRYAAALAEQGRAAEAQKEYLAAMSIDARAARGWWQLMRFGVEKATLAAQADAGIALPGELQPEDCVFIVLAENKRRAGAHQSL